MEMKARRPYREEREKPSTCVHSAISFFLLPTSKHYFYYFIQTFLALYIRHSSFFILWV
jgi:hypothetical protein